MLGRVEGFVRSGEVAEPLKELGAGGWEAHGAKAKVAETEGVEARGSAIGALVGAGGKAVPEEGGSIVGEAKAVGEGWWRC